ncbi:MAG: asparaginase domain-containing protein [Pseudomonadota bacterium]
MEEKSSCTPLRLIYAGGTIGAVGQPLAPMPGTQFQNLWHRHIPAVLPGAEAVEWQHIEPAIDSTDAVPADWARILAPALDAAGRGAAGAIVLHGTDTLAEAAAALSFLTTLTEGAQPVARLAMPLTVLGAMEPLFGENIARDLSLTPAGDAIASLSAAMARQAEQDSDGVRLACDGRLLDGGRAAKLDSLGRPAFACPLGGMVLPPLPVADPSALAERLSHVAPHLGAQSVLVLVARPEAPGRLAAELEALLSARAVAAGAVLMLGFGSGNLPGRDSLGAVVETARARGLPVMIGTRARHGGTALGGYAAGAWLRDLGILDARDMTPEAATTKMHVALALAAAEGWDHATLNTYLSTPIAGELTARDAIT